MFGDVIHQYTTEQAIDDGSLIHPFPEQWPWLLITPGIHSACQTDDNRDYHQKLVPLLIDCVMAAKASMIDNREPPIVLEGTVAGKVWIMPNDKGGMTVMLPEEY